MTKIILLLLSFIMCFTCMPINANAFDFEVSDTPYDDSYYSGFSLADEEIKNCQVEDFSVNDNNEIAVATKKGINIYDQNGYFLYGYIVNTMGSSYSIDFHNDTIEIYRGRPQDYICLNKNGSIINKGFIDEKNNDNKIAVNNISQSKGQRYRKYNEFDLELNSTMTELVKIDENGEKNVIYSAGTVYRTIIITIIIFIFITAIGFIIIFSRKIKRNSNNKN